MIQKMEKVEKARKMGGMLKKKKKRVHAYLSQQPNKAKSGGGGEFSSVLFEKILKVSFKHIITASWDNQ